MTNKITLKKSSVADKVPLSGDLEYGELALNYTDGNLFYKNSSNTITTLASNKFVSVTGNITGNYFIGNGSQLTGISAGGVTVSFSNTAPVGASAGDVWIQANTAVQYVYFDDGTSNQWAEMESYQAYSTTVTSNSTNVDSFTGDGSTVTFALGVTPASADDVTVNYNGATLLHNSYTVSGANITFGSAPASGYQFDVMTLIPGPATPLTTVAGSNTQIQFNNNGNFGASANLTFNESSSSLTATGNIEGGNLITAGLGSFGTTVDVIGNITGGNLNSNAQVVATGNISGGNLTTAGHVVATGNVTAGNVAVTGNVTTNGAPLATTGKAIAMSIVFGF